MVIVQQSAANIVCWPVLGSLFTKDDDAPIEALAHSCEQPSGEIKLTRKGWAHVYEQIAVEKTEEQMNLGRSIMFVVLAYARHHAFIAPS